ncbi:hypothetical protein QQ045_011921 [Rhodiola kirilowii]
MLPEDNTLPNRCYEAKKVMCPMGIDYEKIHACPNDCILYRNSYKDMVECPMCKSPRYKLNKEPKNGSKGTPSKVLWYLPLIPRFQRLFASLEDSDNMRWHAEKRVIDMKMRHPADSLQWAKIDNIFPTFGAECRNLRLGLSTDGVNPHGNLSTQHSTWPVILVIYNLPPRLSMKRKYMMLSLLISGPRQPRNDIDVYLAALIEDLKLLWNEGVQTFDASRQEYFNMRAMLMCTINDFPAYGNLSGRKKAAFNGETEHGIEPRPASGDEILQKIQNITNRFGKPNARTEGTPWKKRSIRGVLSPKVRSAIQRLCAIFSSLSAKVVDSSELDKLQDQIVVTLCQLEMFFPPRFFDVMVHLTLHFVREIRILRPVHMRWMYPFERAAPKHIKECIPKKIRAVVAKRTYSANSEEESDDLVKWLLSGPTPTVYSWNAYDINGFCFHTKAQDDQTVVQNSVLEIRIQYMLLLIILASSKKYGSWITFRVPVFKCKWVNNSAVRTDEYGMTFVDFRREGSKDEPFIMAEQARQVFYVSDPFDNNHFVVLHGKQQLTSDASEDLAEECMPVCTIVPVENDDSEADNEIQLREDHGEGIWIDKEI